MSGSHASLGYLGGDSWLHRVPAAPKIIATLLIVLAVVAVPARTWWPFAVAFVVLVAAAVSARLPMPTVLRRMLIELPFVVFAIALPFFATGPRISVLGLQVSEPGLYAAGGMLAKATIGVLAGVILAATTGAVGMLEGLQRLRMPPVLVEIASFMLRYLSVIGDDLRRMRIARESRGFAGSPLAHVGGVARTAGALFVRSYERGERVHLAMLSRGYAGQLPRTAAPAVPGTPVALVVGVLLVASATVLAWVLR